MDMMIECPECQTRLPADALTCLNCGHPMAPAPEDFREQEPQVPKLAPQAPAKSPKRSSSLILLLILLLGGLAISSQVTIFVIRPIGAIPDGKTLIISRMDKTRFIDSADAMCERLQGGVSLLCRGTTLAGISQNATIYLRLPYLESLYLYSTGGKTYEH